MTGCYCAAWPGWSPSPDCSSEWGPIGVQSQESSILVRVGDITQHVINHSELCFLMENQKTQDKSNFLSIALARPSLGIDRELWNPHTCLGCYELLYKQQERTKRKRAQPTDTAKQGYTGAWSMDLFGNPGPTQALEWPGWESRHSEAEQLWHPGFLMAKGRETKKLKWKPRLLDQGRYTG